MIRSILSIITGIVVWGVLWVIAGMAVAAAMPDAFNEDLTTTETTPLAIFIAVSVVLDVLAGWLCATIARRRMMTHVAILAFIQLGIGIAVQAGVWDQMPQWYHLIFLGLVVPGHLIGGWLRAGKKQVAQPR